MSRSTRIASTVPVRKTLLAAFVATFVTGMANAATTFPDYPLQTGTGSVPPNIMFIMDDSGSMAAWYMPDNIPATTSVNVSYQTYVRNTMYYNPNLNYEPWVKADGSKYTGGDTVTAVFGNDTHPSDQTDLMAWNVYYRTFYVPKAGATDLSNGLNYYRYQIVYVDGAPQVVRSELTSVTSTNLGLANAGCETTYSWGWRNCTLATPTGRDQASELRNIALWFSYARTRAKAAKGGAAKAFVDLGENFRVGFDTIWNRNGATSLGGTTPAYPVPVATDDGLFRGANKTAWFNYLFNSNASSLTPLHGALQRAGRYFEQDKSATGPWGPQAGDAQLACRQNYSILTTDGYWNSNYGFSAMTDASGTTVKNVDGTAGAEIKSPDGERSYTYTPARPYLDTYENTLADIAMRYWNQDLRADLPNKVPSSSKNPAFWQHMVTFGISIGLQGTLDPDNDVALIAAGDKNWPDPWRKTDGGASGWSEESARRIDDLLHASVNGRGEFVAASDPAAFAKALKDSLSVIQRRRASGSNVASNGPALSTGSRLFQATYTSGEWSGDMVAVSIFGGSLSSAPVWSLAEQAAADSRPFYNRPVLTWSGSTGTTFPTTSQLSALARTTGEAPVTGLQNATYIKGYQALEKANGGKLRDRESLIGDIVNSSPFYVAESNTLYIGANDGMLHAIDAATGTVLFSYVPGGVNVASLATLSDPDYQHRFFVDGGIDVTSLSQGQGKNLLVASLGRGGKGVFGLDVTAAATATSSNVLWDKSGPSVDSDMGYVLGAPVVRKANDGSTIALVGNGIDSTNGSAVLFVYNAATGALIREINTGATGANGLAEPRAADVDGDGDVDYVYAGDLKGNVWKFDLSSSNTGKWDVALNGKALFTAKDSTGKAQPITTAVALAREPLVDRIFVLVGTGRYISDGDLSDKSPQSMYGLIDIDAVISGRAALKQRTIPYVGTDSLNRAARSWESYSELPDTAAGWYVDLTVPSAGERVVSAPFVKGRALWFSSSIPTLGDGCDSGGTGYLNAVDAFTGTNPEYSGATFTFIDVNGDGVGNDRVSGAPGTGDNGFVTSVDLGVGMPARGTGVGNNVYACGSDAICGRVQTTAPGTGARRLSWRELFKRN